MFWADIHLNEMNTLRRKLSTPSILISDVEPSQTILSRRSMNIKRDFICTQIFRNIEYDVSTYNLHACCKNYREKYDKIEQHVFCKISEKMSKLTKISINL